MYTKLPSYALILLVAVLPALSAGCAASGSGLLEPEPREAVFPLQKRYMDGYTDDWVEENADLADTIAAQCTDEVTVHGLRTRVAGHVSFAEFHVLVPGAWSVRRAHDVVEDIEEVIAEHHPHLRVTVHIEPSEDPRSYDDFGEVGS